jgi:hypothetical protein
MIVLSWMALHGGCALEVEGCFVTSQLNNFSAVPFTNTLVLIQCTYLVTKEENGLSLVSPLSIAAITALYEVDHVHSCFNDSQGRSSPLLRAGGLGLN